MTESARCTDAGMHSAEARAASMSSAETAVSTGAAGMTAATVPSAMLRPDRYSQQKDERRNGSQATHINLV